MVGAGAMAHRHAGQRPCATPPSSSLMDVSTPPLAVAAPAVPGSQRTPLSSVTAHRLPATSRPGRPGSEYDRSFGLLGDRTPGGAPRGGGRVHASDDDVQVVAHHKSPAVIADDELHRAKESTARQYAQLDRRWPVVSARYDQRNAVLQARLKNMLHLVTKLLDGPDAGSRADLEVVATRCAVAQHDAARKAERRRRYEAVQAELRVAGREESKARGPARRDAALESSADELVGTASGEAGSDAVVDLASSDSEEGGAAASMPRAGLEARATLRQVADAAPASVAMSSDEASEAAVDEDVELDIAAARYLTPAMREEYGTLIAQPDSYAEARTHAKQNVCMKWADFATFAPNEWLSDPCMNFYMAMLQDRDERWQAQGTARPRCLFMSCFFVTKLVPGLTGYEYDEVRRWTGARRFRKLQIGRYQGIADVDKIVFPVHLGNHWTCAVLNVLEEQLEYYDSLGGCSASVVDGLARWLEDDYADKYCAGDGGAVPKQYRATTWKHIINPPGTPRQLNSSDCGVFTLMCANYAGAGVPFDYGQREVHSFFRAMCALECWQGRLRPVG